MSSLAAIRRWPGGLRLLLVGFLVSALGTGMVNPFTTIYLSSVRGFPTSAVATALGLVAGCNVVASFVAGSAVDRWGPWSVAAAGLLAQCAGFVLFAYAASVPVALVAAVLVGVGGGVFYPTSVPMLVAIAPAELHTEAFSARALATSLGIGGGAMLGGLALTSSSLPAYQVLFLANAATYVALCWVVFAVARTASVAVSDAPDAAGLVTPPARGATARALLGQRSLLLLLLVQAVVVVAGYSQFSSAVPLLLTEHLAATSAFVGAMVAASTVVGVLTQLPAGRWADRVGPVRTLATLGVLWSAAWTAGLAAMLVAGPARLALLGALAVLFGLGGSLFHPGVQPMLVRVSRPGTLGRTSGYLASSWGASLVVGPPLGVAVVRTAPAATLWLLLAALCLVIPLLARAAGRAADRERAAAATAAPPAAQPVQEESTSWAPQ